MHFIEAAASMTLGAVKGKLDEASSERTFAAYMVNNTQDTLKVLGSPVIRKGIQMATTEYNLTFKELKPGEAGVVRLQAAGEFSGAQQFLVGDESLFLGASNPLVGKNKFTLSFEEAATKTTEQYYKGMPSEFLGRESSSSIVKGAHHSLRIDGVGYESPGEAHVWISSLESEELAYPEDSLRQLQLVEWCKTDEPSVLGEALFLMDYYAVSNALRGSSMQNQAFALDLLINAFITGGVLSGEHGNLDMNLDMWQKARSEILTSDNSGSNLPSYEMYRLSVQTLSDADIRAYVDKARALLAAAAMHCKCALKQKNAPVTGEVMELKESGIEKRESISSGVEEEDGNADILAAYLAHPHARESIQEDDKKDAKKIKAPDPDAFLKGVVRRCIHTNTDHAQRRIAAFDELEKKLGGPESASNAKEAGKGGYAGGDVPIAGGKLQPLKWYLSWLPLTQRSFVVEEHKDDKGETIPEIHFDTFGTEMFANLGEGTSLKEVLQSLGLQSKKYKSMATNSKSGEFFFFAKDRRFLIKTVTDAEGQLLRSMLPKYQNHLRQNANSLIVKYAGLFHVEIEGQLSKYFTIMGSVFDPECKIHETFDLKGSLFHRKKNEGDSIGKDEDWISRCDASDKLKISEDDRRNLLAGHEVDAAFMHSFNVMDYSLLVGIHHVENESVSEGKYPWWSAVKSTDGKEVYFIGLIDFLIFYGVKKQAENLVRISQGHAHDTSCVNPLDYAKRQVGFLRSSVFACQEENEQATGELGKLKVTVISGHDLVNMDGPFSASDPYATVTLGLNTVKTPVIKSNLNPTWDCVLTLPVNSSHTKSQLTIEVWDEDEAKAISGNDDWMGKLCIPMEEILAEGKKEVEKAKLTEISKGSISLCVEAIMCPKETN